MSKITKEVEEVKTEATPEVTPVAEAPVETPVAVPTKSKEQERKDWLEERVPFYAFQDNDKYKDDIHVGVNGYNYVIKRGVQVNIPRFVFFVIMDAERQRMEANKHSSGLANEFYNESAKRGMM